jgi:acyl-CoA thioester hydrolase
VDKRDKIMRSGYSFKVPFRDVDMHGHVHNSAFIGYFEAAIAAWIDACELNSFFDPAQSERQFFVKKIETVFQSSAIYNHSYKIDVVVSKIGETSLTFKCQIKHAASNVIISDASIVWVCVDRQAKPVALDDQLRAQLNNIQGNR